MQKKTHTSRLLIRAKFRLSSSDSFRVVNCCVKKIAFTMEKKLDPTGHYWEVDWTSCKPITAVSSIIFEKFRTYQTAEKMAFKLDPTGHYWIERHKQSIIARTSPNDNFPDKTWHQLFVAVLVKFCWSTPHRTDYLLRCTLKERKWWPWKFWTQLATTETLDR